MRFLAPPHRIVRLSQIGRLSRVTWALASLSLLWPEAPRAQPVPATVEAARCPEKGGPQPTLKADYDRAQAAFQDVARMFPAAREPEAKAPLSANLAARDVHLRGDLARAQAQLDAAPPGSQAWLQADQEYTQARLREACGMPRAARFLYLNILWTPYALPGTVRCEWPQRGRASRLGAGEKVALDAHSAFGLHGWGRGEEVALDAHCAVGLHGWGPRGREPFFEPGHVSKKTRCGPSLLASC